MSAPHPRFPDTTPSLKRVLAAFAPPPEALRINGYPRSLDQPESEVMRSDRMASSPRSESNASESTSDTSPESATRGDQSNLFDDIGLGLRSLTWDQFVRLAEKWKADPEIIWKWATHGDN